MAGPNRAFSVAGTPSDIYEGHLAYAGGSGQSSLPYLVTPFQSISARAIADRSMIWWILNNTYTETTSSFGGGGNFGGGMMPTTDFNNTATGGVDLSNLGGGTDLSPSIANYASNSAVCLVFMNSDAGEGGDRSELQNADQDTLVTTVAATCNNTIVVINTVGPRLLDAWVEHENVTAVLYGGVLGEESGNAIADVLYGDVTPSGKLTYTIPKNATDYPTEFNVCEESDCNYDEGVYIDYRYFDEQNITVRYPFGYGLSYTNFTYGSVTATTTNASALSYTYATGALGLGGEEDLWYDVVSVMTTIENTGSVVGAEVAQLYITFPDVAAQPLRVLRGFEKATIAVGATAEVIFTLRRRDLSYWDTTAQAWAVASGDYILTVGSSSRDLRSTTTFTI
jgi:beta-glucosidase